MSRTNTTSRLKTFKDDRLDIDRIDHYSLSFFIGPSSIQITVFEEKRKRLLLYEKYTFDRESIIDVLNDIHEDHILISAGFWQTIRVNVDSHQFSIVPTELFSFEHQYDYIKLNSPTDPNIDAYRSVTYDPLEIAFVFALDKAVVKWFSDRYFNLEVRHSHVGLNFIQFADRQFIAKDRQRLFINLTDSEMQVVGIDEGKLAIYNQFQIATAEQMVKYILLTIKQFSEKGQEINISLWGNKSNMTQFEPVLKRYFKRLSIGDRPKIKFGPAFGELESYEIMDVLSIHG